MHIFVHIGNISEVKHEATFMQEWDDLWVAGLAANV